MASKYNPATVQSLHELKSSFRFFASDKGPVCEIIDDATGKVYCREQGQPTEKETELLDKAVAKALKSDRPKSVAQVLADNEALVGEQAKRIAELEAKLARIDKKKPE